MENYVLCCIDIATVHHMQTLVLYCNEKPKLSLLSFASHDHYVPAAAAESWSVRLLHQSLSHMPTGMSRFSSPSHPSALRCQQHTAAMWRPNIPFRIACPGPIAASVTQHCLAETCVVIGSTSKAVHRGRTWRHLRLLSMLRPLLLSIKPSTSAES